MPSKTWSATMTITGVDPDARTFTAQISDVIWDVVQSQPYLADGIALTLHVPDVDTNGDPVTQPYVQVGDVTRVTIRVG